MKKLLFILTVFVLTFSQSAKAQYENGDVLVNVGLGLGSYYATGSGFSTTLPAIEVGPEFFVAEEFSVGGFIGVYLAKYKFGYFESKYNYMNIGALGNYHLVNTSQWNVYAGARLGYVNEKVSNVTEDDPENGNFNSSVDGRGSGVLFGIQLGARYFLIESIAINAELGYGISILKVGVTVSL